MKRMYDFKNKDIAEICRMDLENEMLKTEEVEEHNGKYRVTYYTENYLQEGTANKTIRKYTIG